MRMVVATKNKGKIKEITEILQDLGIQVVSQDELNIKIDVVEDGTTFEENAVKKASEIMNISKEITLADDSGLEVDYLNGAPGIYSARYAGPNATDYDNNNKLLKALEGVPFEKRTARFVCAIAAVFPDGRKIVARGECEGIINFQPAGQNGFGYDPLFYIPEYGMTMAEIDPQLKNKISHRAKALNMLKEELKKYISL
ncbi:MAG: XTP/dITP diphosphohydrolase [Petroclostridium sp.]|uniref:XTP/dITP diphosphatase n=1 Tax=Petroclostridium xylanilyticum TaxID=1792311 RepID=UPI000B9896B0|nr:XTP/dITP diphosphatase [Petroclostridium xylanilyticum]MDK2810600.1 XTP/dITP diphosphohydrolase [Petroclostridium sp.]